VHLNVHVTPKGGRDRIDGWKTDADGRFELAIRVSVAPEDGKATKAAGRLLARALGVPVSSVRCVSGQTSRHKRFEVDLEPEPSADELHALFPEA